MAMFVKHNVLVACMGQLARQITDEAGFLVSQGLNAEQLAASVDAATGRLSEHKRQSVNADIAAKEKSIQWKKTRIQTQQLFSNIIEMVAGTFGKSTPKGRQILKLRSRVIQSNKNRRRKRKTSPPQNKPDKK